MKKKWVINYEILNNLLFFLAYSIYLFFSILDYSFYSIFLPNNLVKYVMIFCCILLICKELLVKKITKKELLLLIFCFCLSILLVYRMNKIVMLPFSLLIYSARNIKFEKIAKMTVIETTLLLIFVIFSAKFNWIYNYVSYSSSGRIRHYLGFRYVLYPQMLLFNISALLIYIKKKKNIILYILILFVNLLLFKYTDARLSAYLTCGLVFLIWLQNNKLNHFFRKKIIKTIMVFSFVICSSLSLWVTYRYDSNILWMRNLNKILENRLYYGKNALNTYKVTLFGNNINFVGNGLDKYGRKSTSKYDYVDCLYLSVLEKYGILFFVILIYIGTKALHRLSKNNNYEALIIITVIAIHAMIDDLGIYLCFNSFWFLISNYFVINNKEEMKQNEISRSSGYL